MSARRLSIVLYASVGGAAARRASSAKQKLRAKRITGLTVQRRREQRVHQRRRAPQLQLHQRHVSAIAQNATKRGTHARTSIS